MTIGLNLLYIGGSSQLCYNAFSLPTPVVNLKINTTSLQTCDALQIDLSGGQKPYDISIVPQGSSMVRNVTLGPEDDRFIFINNITTAQSFIGKCYLTLRRRNHLILFNPTFSSYCYRFVCLGVLHEV